MSPPVAFVGAGPGDPDLLTLKAVDRLRAADIVLYDDLGTAPALAHVRRNAELVAVGKRAGRPSPRQADVSALLVAHARAGGRVVRLKAGDPGLFGRLEEEVAALRDAGLPFEIVPGVSAASAAAAAAGVPLTRRSAARRVQFVTGHDATGALPAERNMTALADAQAVTAVFMPKRTFAALAADLVAHGLPPDTPALLAQAVGQPDERLERGTVATIAARLAADPPEAAAVVLYGALMDGP